MVVLGSAVAGAALSKWYGLSRLPPLTSSPLPLLSLTSPPPLPSLTSPLSFLPSLLLLMVPRRIFIFMYASALCWIQLISNVNLQIKGNSHPIFSISTSSFFFNNCISDLEVSIDVSGSKYNHSTWYSILFNYKT